MTLVAIKKYVTGENFNINLSIKLAFNNLFLYVVTDINLLRLI